MDARKMKAAAEWFHSQVFRDEAIRPQPVRKTERLPSILRAARSLENKSGQHWKSRDIIFMQQAKLLANYTDDYEYSGRVQCYYPTYQALSDQELRGYFSWRTKLREGELRETSRSFAFLYIYEIINRTGAEDDMEGYRRLLAFRDAYGQIDSAVLPYLNQWIGDYAVYYRLDPELLSGSAQVLFDRSVLAFEQLETLEPERIIQAVKYLAPKWLSRSRFYASHREEMDAVMVPVLRRMSQHYAARCRKTLAEQYFGSPGRYQARPFESAVFCDPLKRRNYEYAVDERCVFRCENGIWSVWKRTVVPGAGMKLETLMKTIDCEMRQAFDYRHPVRSELETKWILRIIREEIQALAAEKRAVEEKKIAIDYTQLTRIRQDAAITQERLIVEEEEFLPQEEAPERTPEPEESADGALAPAERRLLQCLLYGGDTGWVQAEGYLLSVLADGVNEKLYDLFQDSVLDGTPQVIEDYMDDLKEMVGP